MPEITPLLEIVDSIENVFNSSFKNKTYWIKADISSLRKTPYNWYYFDFIDKSSEKEICIKGICRNFGAQSVRIYETMTGNTFKSGINLTCKVQINYYKEKNHPELEILELDYATEIGKQEIERRQTLDKLVKENPKHIKFVEGKYVTTNNSIVPQRVIQKIALITASNSDGQRDFMKSLEENEYKYDFYVSQFPALMQGDRASTDILDKLKQIEKNKQFFDAVVICRGGGSDSDFHAFNNFELSNYACSFPIPILTGIGHDRNTSILDIVSTQLMNPAQVGAFILKKSLRFNYEIQELERRLDSQVEDIMGEANSNLDTFKQTIKNLSPDSILRKGFAIVSIKDQIVSDPKKIKHNTEITTLLKGSNIYSKVLKVKKK